MPAALHEINAVTEPVIGLAIRVHRALGPGLLEGVSCACLVHELRKSGARFVAQRAAAGGL